MGYWEAKDATINTGNGSNGWPLFDTRFASAMVAQFYDWQENTTGTNFAQVGGEQPISTLPAWTSLYVTVNNQTFLPYVNASITEYSQNMSIRDGIVTTSMVWNGVRLNYTILAHRTRPTLGIVRLELSPISTAVNLTITDMLDGAGSWRTTFNDSSVNATSHQLITAVQPSGISNVYRHVKGLIVGDRCRMFAIRSLWEQWDCCRLDSDRWLQCHLKLINCISRIQIHAIGASGHKQICWNC